MNADVRAAKDIAKRNRDEFGDTWEVRHYERLVDKFDSLDREADRLLMRLNMPSSTVSPPGYPPMAAWEKALKEEVADHRRRTLQTWSDICACLNRFDHMRQQTERA